MSIDGLPDVVAHADWSTDAKKRWMAVAQRGRSGYEMGAPEPVGPLPSLLPSLSARRAGNRPILLGFDFPIGLPATYAKEAGVHSFVEALPMFGSGKWKSFFDIANSPKDVSLGRPFYPLRPGGTRQVHLVQGLRVDCYQRLLRRCEQRTSQRGAASSLFWTLGGKQVGRAAIVGWRDVLAPALREPADDVSLWPFHGNLPELLRRFKYIIAETYPAEAGLQLLGPPGHRWSKRRQADRRKRGAILFDWAKSRGVGLMSGLRARIADGFGASESGEDPFDAVVGLASMIDVVTGHRAPGAPNDPEVRKIEGWIFGLSRTDAG